MDVVVGVSQVDGFYKVYAGMKGYVVPKGKTEKLVVDGVLRLKGDGATRHTQSCVRDLRQFLNRAAGGVGQARP